MAWEILSSRHHEVIYQRHSGTSRERSNEAKHLRKELKLLEEIRSVQKSIQKEGSRARLRKGRAKGSGKEGKEGSWDSSVMTQRGPREGANGASGNRGQETTRINWVTSSASVALGDMGGEHRPWGPISKEKTEMRHEGGMCGVKKGSSSMCLIFHRGNSSLSLP